MPSDDGRPTQADKIAAEVAFRAALHAARQTETRKSTQTREAF